MTNRATLAFLALVILTPILWEVGWWQPDVRYHVLSRAADLFFPYYTTTRLDFSDAEYDIYREFYGRDARVLNPGTFYLHLTDELGNFVTQDELTEAEQDALNVWRGEKSAANLRAAGIDYLFVTPEWWSFITEEEFQTFNDPTQYELVAEATDDFVTLRVFRTASP